MDSTDLAVLKTCIGWLESGHHVMLATVVQTWGSAPRPVGSWLVIRDDGQLIGSVSGGCVEDDLIDRVRAELPSATLPHIVRYGVSRDEATRFGLPCGGTLRLVLEPRPELVVLKALLARVSAKLLTTRVLDLHSGLATLSAAQRSDILQFDEQCLRAIHGPRWRMVLIGAGELSHYVAQIALGADYEVIVIDPREEFGSVLALSDVTFSRGMPDDVLIELAVDNHTAIVALTHDPKLDDLALMEGLKSAAFYVGALGSRANTARRRERLLEFDLTARQIDRLHGPVGLYLGANTPAEMAISILAEITAAKHQVPILQKREISSGQRQLRTLAIDTVAVS
ncbi:MAG: xanthine dehydrogenase accessory factor [Bradyrhizobium sp.]|jgi:xanthine dehydrogenase accessory factor